MSGADNEPKEHASGSEDASNVPTQRRGSCGCGHPDADHDHPFGAASTAERVGGRSSGAGSAWPTSWWSRCAAAGERLG